MTSVLPSPTDPPDIENASRDRISTLQLERLQWSLKHAYDNVPHYKKAFDDAGVHPTDMKDLSDLSKCSFERCCCQDTSGVEGAPSPHGTREAVCYNYCG